MSDTQILDELKDISRTLHEIEKQLFSERHNEKQYEIIKEAVTKALTAQNSKQ